MLIFKKQYIIRITILWFLHVCLIPILDAQPPQITLGEKKLYVYPLRSNATEIPPYFAPLPDGDYIIYREYSFKKKFLKKAYKLRDTTVVNGFFSLKDNLPHGKAIFYSTNSETIKGSFAYGLRDGEWETTWERIYRIWFKKYKEKSHSITTYKNGLMEGPFTKWVNDKLDTKGNYKNDLPAGHWEEYYDGAIRKQYTYADSITNEKTLYDKIMPYDYESKGLHGWEITYDYFNTGKPNRVLHEYGSIKYFDTLRTLYGGQVHYILTKTEPDKPDTSAIFKLTEYDIHSTRAKEVETYYKNGSVLKSIRFLEDGEPYSGTYTAAFYQDLKRGQPYLKEFYGNEQRGMHTYGIKGFTQELERTVYGNDTVQNFRIYNMNVAKKTFNYTVIEHDKTSDITCHRYYTWREQEEDLMGNTEHGTNRRLIRHRHRHALDDSEETLDSVRIFYKGNPFTGVLKSVGRAHKEKNKKHRVKEENGTLVMYAMYGISMEIPYTHYNYAEIKNGRSNGKMIQKNHYGRERTTTIHYEVNGKDHGEYSRYTRNYKLNKYERRVARELGIKKRRISYYTAKGNYVNGKEDGLWMHWHETGLPADSVTYKNGLKEGTEISWYMNRQLRSKRNYINGELDGLAQAWADNGRLLFEAEYKNGNLNGDLKIYKATGELDFSIYAQNNILEKEAKLYNRLGLLEWKLDFNAVDSVPYEMEELDPITPSLYDENATLSWYNENLVTNLQLRLKAYPASFSYTEYFYTGRIAAEGKFKDGRMNGPWKFYDLDGNLIHEVNFAPEEISLPADTFFCMGRIKSYYTNGKLRSEGFLENFNRDYDCQSKKNVYNFFILYENYWEMDGRQTLAKGNGAYTEYDEHGQRQQSGEMAAYERTGLWKTWDKDVKLSSMGHYEHNMREGVWWEGDLEGLSFIDNACYDDINAEEVQKEINALKKNIHLVKSIYQKNMVISSQEFNLDMNTEKEYREGYGHGYGF